MVDSVEEDLLPKKIWKAYCKVTKTQGFLVSGYNTQMKTYAHKTGIAYLPIGPSDSYSLDLLGFIKSRLCY